MVATIPIWTALFSAVVLKETIPRVSVVAVGAGFAGLMALAVDTRLSADSNTPIALLVALAGVVVCWLVLYQGTDDALGSNPGGRDANDVRRGVVGTHGFLVW